MGYNPSEKQEVRMGKQQGFGAGLGVHNRGEGWGSPHGQKHKLTACLTRVVASTMTPCLISTSATGTWPSCATRWRGVSPLWKETEVHHLVANKDFQATEKEHWGLGAQPSCVATEQVCDLGQSSSSSGPLSLSEK